MIRVELTPEEWQMILRALDNTHDRYSSPREEFRRYEVLTDKLHKAKRGER